MLGTVNDVSTLVTLQIINIAMINAFVPSPKVMTVYVE